METAGLNHVLWSTGQPNVEVELYLYALRRKPCRSKWLSCLRMMHQEDRRNPYKKQGIRSQS